MVNTDKCVTVIEFANAAGITRQAVNKMIKQGRIGAHLFGKTFLIERHHLEHYLAHKKR
jgi:excisionase family DNA binding protein